MAVAQFVVGVDGSESTLQALQWAIAESGRHAAKLVAITTWTALPPPIVSPYVDVSELGNRTDAPSAAEQALKDVLEDGWPTIFRLPSRWSQPRDIRRRF